jgi:serine/threonine protein kinase/Leucine-rich repeat (LRR) protein
MTPPAPQKPNNDVLQQRASKIDAVFAAARAKPLHEREAFVAAECGGDESLRAEVLLLLASIDARCDLASELKPSPDVEAELARLKPEETGDRIGPYKLLQQIGEGGFGVVWMAEQEEPVRRRVAVKIIKLGMDTKEVVARFNQERQALALMDHPNIARVLDAGATQLGRPFFVMELVRGVKITEYCDEQRLSTHERIELFITVCQAVQHAHQKGIIHRDLKPSNILVTINDGDAVPKVIDFGVAKTTQGRLTDLTLFTQFEQMIGTPLYMSPEQAEMTSLDIDTRSDIYSLGVLLYDLLTGRTPIDKATLARAGMDEVRRMIREVDPQRPSLRVKTLAGDELTTTAKRRQIDATKLPGTLRGDLDWIVMKCLEKDRKRRYDTANGLALDLQRHLQNEIVTARPPTAGYLLGKVVRRNKFAVIAGTAIAASLLIGIAVSVWQAVRANRALHRLRAAAPTFHALSRELVKDEKFTEALEQVSLAIELDGNNPDFLLWRANLLQSTQRIAEAANGYRTVLAFRPDEAARLNLDLCERLLRENHPGSPLSRDAQTDLYHALLDQDRGLEAVPLGRELRLGLETAEMNIKARLRGLTGIEGFDWNRLRRLEDGTFLLSLADLKASELPDFSGLPISQLDIHNTNITDLTPLRGLKLRLLHGYRTQVRDISPLAGMPLEEISLNSPNAGLQALKGMPLRKASLQNCPISDLSILAAANLEYLVLNTSPCEDLSPLRGQAIVELRLRETRVRDLSPLAGMPLRVLDLGGTQVTDLSPLAGMPLEELDIMGTKVTDLHPLLECKNLRVLALPKMEADIGYLREHTSLLSIDEDRPFWDVRLPAAEFWKGYDARRKPIQRVVQLLNEAGIPAEKRDFKLNEQGHVESVTIHDTSIGDLDLMRELSPRHVHLHGVTLTMPVSLPDVPLESLCLEHCKGVESCDAIRHLPSLTWLNLSNTSIKDISGLQGLKLKHLYLDNTQVRDIEALRGMPLEELDLRRTEVRDVSSLLACPTLQVVLLPDSVKNVALLRDHPSIRNLSFAADGKTEPTMTTAAEFWADFDAKKSKP